MKIAQIITGVLFIGATLVGCGGGSNNNSTPTPTTTPTLMATPTGSPSVGSCATGLPSFVSCDDSGSEVIYTLSGTVDADYTMPAAWNWMLEGIVIVGAGNVEVTSDADVTSIIDNGVTLTIEAGADIKADEDGVLLVTRGSKLMAEGTPTAPITFSSEDDGYDGEGEWGGVVVQGFAPQYGPGGTGACYGSGTTCNLVGEGSTDDVTFLYGGDITDDDSGIIRYVRIAEGGLVRARDAEVNGLTLQGVGHGTTVEYIHVHGNLDDGVEWFGGTVDVKYLVLTNNDDDDIDFDEGYMGNIQYAIVKKNQVKTAPTGSNDPRGIEANSSDDEYVPETRAVLSNITLIGAQVSDGEPGMRLRGALNVQVHNTAVTGFDRSCVRIDDADTDGDDTVDEFSSVALNNVIGNCVSGFYHNDREADTATNAGAGSVTIDAALALTDSAASLASPVSITAVDNGSMFTFDATSYVGAVAPGTSAGEAWWAGWTIPGAFADLGFGPAEADFVSCDDTTMVCTVSGTIDEDYSFISGYTWLLEGIVIVGAGNVEVASDADVTAIQDAGVTLTIDPGVSVVGDEDGVLLVTRGSKLNAAGTASQPITFSSEDAGYDGEGEWGGVVIQGFAPQYGPGGTGACYGAGTTCNLVGEGTTDDVTFLYGGNITDDDSGVIRYVRIAEGGLVRARDAEVNGLTLQGVGHETVVEYVHVHGNLDDGVEWFGGTVNAKYLVLTNNDDDDIDFDEGYMGNIQYAIVAKNQTKEAPTGSNDPRGIEANSSDDEYVPETEAVLSNITLIGAMVSDGEPGMRLRGALTVQVHNTAVTAFDRSCVRIDDADTNGDDTNDEFSTVALNNVIGECVTGFYHNDRSADTETNAGADDVTIDEAFALTDAAASLGSPASITAVANGSDFAFDATDYVGAVEPGTAAADAWWAGWIIDGALDAAIANH